MEHVHAFAFARGKVTKPPYPVKTKQRSLLQVSQIGRGTAALSHQRQLELFSLLRMLLFPESTKMLGESVSQTIQAMHPRVTPPAQRAQQACGTQPRTSVMNNDLPIGTAIRTSAAIAPQSLLSPTPEKPSVPILRAIAPPAQRARENASPATTAAEHRTLPSHPLLI